MKLLAWLAAIAATVLAAAFYWSATQILMNGPFCAPFGGGC